MGSGIAVAPDFARARSFFLSPLDFVVFTSLIIKANAAFP